MSNENDNSPFRINLSSLKTKEKSRDKNTIDSIDQLGENHGFTDRKQVKKRGRSPSPRTGQIHAKVLPNISIEISNEAKRRGIQQGVIIEEAWDMYKKQNNIK